MNIQSWPLDRIMQLPDHAFGRRWPVGLGFTLSGPGAKFDISEAALPDRMVVWGVNITAEGAGTATNHMKLAMAQKIPASEAELSASDLVFSGITSTDGGIGEFEATPAGGPMLDNLRMPVAAQGRRLIGQCKRHVGASVGGTITLIISSVPTEVPDWLGWDILKNR